MSELRKIITADCSFPKEIDDGLFVHPVDEDHETYKVGVCVADTSQVYHNQEIFKQANQRTEAKYWDLPDGERGYDPMIDSKIIKGLEFTAGSVRDALIISFIVGRKHKPSNLDISFGRVKVTKNLNYKDFALSTRSEAGERFLRASEFIKQHIKYVAYGDHRGTKPVWRDSADQNTPQVSNFSESAWKRGSKINETFMVSANHLVGKQLKAEDELAIYRVYDPSDEQYLELVSPNVALYSRQPGPHLGLKLDPYCRVTSPLRRLDDFMMNYQLKRRSLGKEPTAQDVREVAFAIRRLNQEVIAAAPKEMSRFSRHDILGRTALGHQSRTA